MNRRLVSVFYRDAGPFMESGLFNDLITSNNPDELTPEDVIVVWGGADISPSLYKREKSHLCWADEVPSRRDQVEWDMMQRAIALNIPIIGICRGAQMLCAAAGGYLMQHVNGHGGSHHVETYKGDLITTNSIHHQMMVPLGTEHEVLAQIPVDKLRSDVYWDGNQKVDHKQEPEFIYFNKVRGFAVQWHPEMMSPSCAATKFIFDEMENRLG